MNRAMADDIAERSARAMALQEFMAERDWSQKESVLAMVDLMVAAGRTYPDLRAPMEAVFVLAQARLSAGDA